MSSDFRTALGCYDHIDVQYNRNISNFSGNLRGIVRLCRGDTIRNGFETSDGPVHEVPATWQLIGGNVIRITPVEGFINGTRESTPLFSYYLKALESSTDLSRLRDTVYSTRKIRLFTRFVVDVSVQNPVDSVSIENAVFVFGSISERFFEETNKKLCIVEVNAAREKDDSIEVRAYHTEGWRFSHWSSSSPDFDGLQTRFIKVRRMSCWRSTDVQDYENGQTISLKAHYIKAPPPPPRDTKYIAISTDGYVTWLDYSVRFGKGRPFGLEVLEDGQYLRFQWFDEVRLRQERAKNRSFVYQLLTDSTYYLSGLVVWSGATSQEVAKGGRPFVFSNVDTYNNRTPVPGFEIKRNDSVLYPISLGSIYPFFTPDTLRLDFRWVPGPSSSGEDISKEMRVFPNPANGEDVTLTLPKQIRNQQVLVTISDQQGRIVFRQESTAALNAVQLPYGNLEQGRYHIAVQSGSYVGATSLCII